MHYNQLGRTGLFVSELCLGTMTFGGVGEFWSKMGKVQQEQVNDIVRTALDAGINFIDTADVYSEGMSERFIGQALRTLGVKRSSVAIATKTLGPMGSGPNDRGAGRGHIMDSVKASLERLGTDYIDLYQMHGSDMVVPVEETMRALDDLVSQGLVRYVGMSNWQAWRIMKANGFARQHGWARIESIQAHYTIACRDIEREIVPLATDEALGLMVWSPLAGGLLSGKFGPGSNGPENTRRVQLDFPPVDRDMAWKCVDAMREIAERRGASVARVALAWLLAKPHVTTVIIGAKSTEQLSDNIAAASFDLTAQEVAHLDEVSTPRQEYPGWMVARQALGRPPARRTVPSAS
jgi:aryl-alcohol dehydrogenase-like predicted oxidoreductase